MLRRIRLLTGIILFFYVSLHLLNLIAGLWSLPVLEATRQVLHSPWNTLVGKLALYTAFAVHIILALYALYTRRSFSVLGDQLSVGEVAQLLLGFLVPVLLLSHVLGTRVLSSISDANISYASVVVGFWLNSPGTGIKQIFVLLAAWVHGCIGLYYWLRLRQFFSKSQPYLYALALLIPVLSLLGYWQASKEALRLAQDDQWLAALWDATKLPQEQQQMELFQWQNWLLAAYAGLLVLTFGLRYWRAHREAQGKHVNITYEDGANLQFPSGVSILEASRSAGIAHASICGGRGRCSTCRVRIVSGHEHLAPPDAAEAGVLKRINAAENVRLACQVRPASGALDIVRLLPAHRTEANEGRGTRRPAYVHGQELEIAVLFADLRAFTQLAENKLPYDVVFLLNQYFVTMGAAIEQAGGRLDKFIGDGIMALFGIEGGPRQGSRSALQAAILMSQKLAELNQAMADDLDSPLRIGIGIHCGPTIVGEMGYGRAKSVTAIGDTVNSASRLEAQTKAFTAELIVSAATLQFADIAPQSAMQQQQINIRGRVEPMNVYVIPTASELSSVLMSN